MLNVECCISGLSNCYGNDGGPLTLIDSNVQVGIMSFLYSFKCHSRHFPNGFTRVSEVADWVKDTVCSKTGELCKIRKAGKTSKWSKAATRNMCVPVPTEAPEPSPQPSTPYPSYTPTITAQPSTPWPTVDWSEYEWPTVSPTLSPTNVNWPTWVPTSSLPPKAPKAGKKE